MYNIHENKFNETINKKKYLFIYMRGEPIKMKRDKKN